MVCLESVAAEPRPRCRRQERGPGSLCALRDYDQYLVKIKNKNADRAGEEKWEIKNGGGD